MFPGVFEIILLSCRVNTRGAAPIMSLKDAIQTGHQSGSGCGFNVARRPCFLLLAAFRKKRRTFSTHKHREWFIYQISFFFKRNREKKVGWLVGRLAGWLPTVCVCVAKTKRPFCHTLLTNTHCRCAPVWLKKNAQNGWVPHLLHPVVIIIREL